MASRGQGALAENQIQTLILGLYYTLSPQLWVPSNIVSWGQVCGASDFFYKLRL